MNILKSTLTICLFLILIAPTFAQVNFGVRGGVNFANQSFSETQENVEYKSNLLLQAGLLVNITLTNDFSFQPELNFIQKGSTSSNDFTSFGLGIIEADITFNYLEIPIMAKYKFGTDAMGGFVQAGPSFGYGLSGKAEFEDESIDVDWEEDDLSRTDTNLQFGAGFYFDEIFVDLRYLMGVSNLNTFDDGLTVKNKGINLSVGYIF